MLSTTTASSIEAVLHDLRRELPRSLRTRGLVAEMRDGLEDAAEAYRDAGFTPAAAAQRAVDDFGDVHSTAELCRQEISATSTIRAAAAVAGGYPVILAFWFLFAVWYGPGSQFGDGGSTSSGVSAGAAFTLVGAVTVGCAVATVWLTRRHSRRFDGLGRMIGLGFALMTTLSMAMTYVLAATTHAQPHADAAEVLARTLAQRASLAVSLLMLLAAGDAARHALTSARQRYSHRIR